MEHLSTHVRDTDEPCGRHYFGVHYHVPLLVSPYACFTYRGS